MLLLAAAAGCVVRCSNDVTTMHSAPVANSAVDAAMVGAAESCDRHDQI
jgi:hypothetical protein